MTPWEWSMAIVVLGPILAVIALWFLTREQAQTASASLFMLTGAAGILACGYGIVTTEPFVLPTDVFFGMIAAFDKLSAMFFFPFALIILALGMRWYAQRVTAPYATLQVIGAALIVAGTTWVLFSTNILGLVAALSVILCGEACLAPLTVRHVVLRSIGVIALAMGLFILSSGALFNDFATLAYIAAEIDPTRLAGAFAAVLVGVTALSGGWPFTRAMSRQTAAVHAGAAQALIRSAYVIIPLYLFIRVLLFILPPLTVWFAVPVSAIGVLTILSATHIASKHRAFAETTWVFGVGVALFMLSSAMSFQSLGAFEAMNVALFATVFFTIGIVLSGAAEEYAPPAGVAEHTAMHVALVALPPSVCFVSVWMFVSGVVVQQGAFPRSLALWFVIGTLFLLGALVRRGHAAIAAVRSLLVRSDRPGFSKRDGSFLLLMFVSTIGALFIPFVLSVIGAGPLTLGAESWRGAVVAGDGILSLPVLLTGIVVLSGMFWLLRDRALTVSVGSPLEAPRPVEFAESRMTVLPREMYKTAVYYVTAPGIERIQKFRSWHDMHASKPVTPEMGLMLFTVILTLALAL